MNEITNTSLNEESKSLFKYYLALIVCILAWSSVPLASKVALDSFGPITFAWLRGITGFMVVLPIALKHGLKFRCFFTKNAIFYGLMAFVFNTMLMQVGMQWCSANVASILNATMPVLMLIGGVAFLSEKMTAWKGLGAVLATLGIIITCLGGSLIDEDTTILGILIVATAPLTWTIYSIYMKKNDPETDPIIICAYLLGCGSMISLPLMIGEITMVTGFPMVGFKSWLLAAYAGMVCLGIGNVAWTIGVSHIEASISGLLYNTCPILGVFLAVAYGEKVSALQIIGCAIVIIGIMAGMKEEFAGIMHRKRKTDSLIILSETDEKYQKNNDND